MKKYLICLIAVGFLFGLSGMVFAAEVADPTGDQIAGTEVDITAARAEVQEDAMGGNVDLLKLTLKVDASSHMPGLVVFEADVDNSTGTGGTLGMTGIPVSPCPCKTCAGFDIIVMILTRQQGHETNTAICHNCSGGEPPASCSRRREAGEWYAIPTAGTYTGASPIGNQGVLRGYLLPLPRGPEDAATQDCYTLPWSHIIVYAWRSLLEEGNPKIFSYQKATENNHANNKWQVSAWNDATFADGDDFGDAAGTLFDINDWVPNGDCNKASIDAADNLTYCEGNFDADQDVDGTDAATFKSDFGRSPFKNPCPRCRN